MKRVYMKYEYRVERLDLEGNYFTGAIDCTDEYGDYVTNKTKSLDSLGSDGWRLAATIFNGSDFIYGYFIKEINA